MAQTNTDRVAREDLALFINAAFVCTGQREFYGSSDGQAVSIVFLHEYILGNYRLLYARTLAANINDFNTALVIANLLATGRDTRETNRLEEGALLSAALRTLPTQRVLRLFDNLRLRRVNNRRTRAVIAQYLSGQDDPAFVALKYRRRVRSLARHAHLKLGGEIGSFLFDRNWPKEGFSTPLFEAFRKAHFSQQAIYQLPYSIAQGLAAKHGIPADVFLEKISQRMTRGEKLRMQNASSQAGVAIAVDLGRTPLTKLALYLCSLTSDKRRQQAAKFTAAMEESARRAYRFSPTKLGKVAAILDRSYSSSGSSEKARRPLAVAMGTSALLRSAATEYRAFWTPALSPTTPEILASPLGQTNLANPFLSALEWGAETIIIVSDGYENDPPGAMYQLALRHRRYQIKLGQAPTVILHLNPVFDSEDYAPRSLGAAIPTIGLRNAEDALTQLAFARFAEGSCQLRELEQFLLQRISGLLSRNKASQ